MPQQTSYSQYGNHRSYYGNIQYGAAPRFYQIYGAWPEKRPAQKGMLVSDWQKPVTEDISVVQYDYADEISSRIEIIRELKKKIADQDDLKQKNILRKQMRIERNAKERAFKIKAMIDEEESLFMLLH